ncbi:hypothetical protein [Streptomyces sp. NPDC085529]|uniref:hypothetical protein n=1 Tax=Streptomyces sp. NPDC085529 TaxID=3365729 RepID=UPI0037D5FEC3
MTLAYGFGRPVDAEVTRLTEYGCAVAWNDSWDGTPYTAEVDCERDASGGTLRINVLPWPLRGEAFDRDCTPFALGLLTVLGLGTALAGTVLRSRRAGGATALAQVPVDKATGPLAPPERPALTTTEDVLTRDHLAAVAAVLLGRAPHNLSRAKKRRTEPDPRTAPWWRSPALRRLMAGSGISWNALIALAVIAGWSAGWWTTTARLSMDVPTPAIATVERLYDESPLEPWLLPAHVETSFTTAEGQKVVTDTAVSGPAPAEGDTLGGFAVLATATTKLAAYGDADMELTLRGLELKTRDPYLSGWRLRVVPSLGHLSVRMITNSVADRTVQNWIADEYGRSTVKNTLAVLVRVMEQAVRDGIIKINPARHGLAEALQAGGGRAPRPSSTGPARLGSAGRARRRPCGRLPRRVPRLGRGGALRRVYRRAHR